jgi:hypothetical protein
MLTFVGTHSCVTICIHSLGRFMGMNLPKTRLLCFCERCGYGRSDHPKTVGKPWVVMVRPHRCEGCGSPDWDAPTLERAMPAGTRNVASATSIIGRGAGISLSD